MRLMSNVVIGFSLALFSTTCFADIAVKLPLRLSECLEAIEEGRILYEESNKNFDRYRVIHDGLLYLYELNGDRLYCYQIVMDN